MSGAGAFLAPEITLPASAEALARSRATRKLTLEALLVATEVVVVREEAVVPMVVDGVRRGRGVARVDGTGNLPVPPTVAVAAAAPNMTLPASAEALARSNATRYSTLGALLVVVLLAMGAVGMREEVVVVSAVMDGVRRGRGVARVDGTGNLPAPPTVVVAATVGAVVAVVAEGAAFSSLLFFSAFPPW